MRYVEPMPAGPSVLVSALRLLALSALASIGGSLLGCQGSERVIFEPVLGAGQQPESGGTGGRPDSGSEPVTDAGDDAGGGDSAVPFDAGEPSADAGLDPSVRFDWTETLPGQGTCSPAHYVGSFACTVEQPTGPAPLGGQIRLDLAGSAEGQLSIENGVLSDLSGLLFSSTLEGSLDCVAQRFDALTRDGIAFPIGGVLLPFRTFEAHLDGTFDEQTLEVRGDIVMTNDAGQVCIGTFQAGVAP